MARQLGKALNATIKVVVDSAMLSACALRDIGRMNRTFEPISAEHTKRTEQIHANITDIHLLTGIDTDELWSEILRAAAVLPVDMVTLSSEILSRAQRGALGERFIERVGGRHA